MILVDTSVWIDHLRKGDERLQGLLENGQVLSHPFVIGEIAMGSFRQRDLILAQFRNLPQIQLANDREVLFFVAEQSLFGLGIGYIDAHLLAAVQLATDTMLWTRDKRLLDAAAMLRLASQER